MIAADTNVLVRYLTEGDDAEQAVFARKLFEENRILVTLTVLLETEWVLRANFRIGRHLVLSSLRALAGLPHVTLQAAPAVKQAIDWSSQGLDFADALHLATSADAELLVTFDRDFARSAPVQGATPVRLLSGD